MDSQELGHARPHQSVKEDLGMRPWSSLWLRVYRTLSLHTMGLQRASNFITGPPTPEHDLAAVRDRCVSTPPAGLGASYSHPSLPGAALHSRIYALPRKRPLLMATVNHESELNGLPALGCLPRPDQCLCASALSFQLGWPVAPDRLHQVLVVNSHS